MPSDKSQTLVVIPEKLEGVPDLGSWLQDLALRTFLEPGLRVSYLV